MKGNNFIIYTLTLTVLFSSFVEAASRGKNETPPPQIYTERARALLDSISSKNVLSEQSPFPEEHQKEITKILKKEDSFFYDQPDTLKIKNKLIPVSLRDRGVIVIKLGHTYNTTIVFTDMLGNPWTVKTLADVSNSEVVSVLSPAPHIMTVKPKKMSGQTNLPVKLEGEQYPIMLMFDII